MKELDWIIHEQAELLRRKGYNEAGLNNPDVEGAYRLQLKGLIADLIDQDPALVTDQLRILHLFGYYNKEVVSFQFQYTYDPYERTLQLQSVKASIGEVELEDRIESERHLMKSTEFYERLKNFQQTVYPHLEQSWRQKLDHSIKKQVGLLVRKGYGNSDQLTARFEKTLSKVKDATSPEYDFQFKCKIKEPSFEQALYCRFHFTVYPFKSDLHLKSIYFQIGKTTELLLHPLEYAIPIPQVAYNRLQLKAHCQKADLLDKKPTNHHNNTVPRKKK